MDLKDEPFITTALEIDFGFGEFTEAVTKLAGYSPTVVKRATDAYGLLTYVACGFGVGVIGKSMSKLAIPNVAYRDLALASPPQSPVACFHRRNETAPATLAFIRTMSCHLDEGRGGEAAAEPPREPPLTETSAEHREDDLPVPVGRPLVEYVAVGQGVTVVGAGMHHGAIGEIGPARKRAPEGLPGRKRHMRVQFAEAAIDLAAIGTSANLCGESRDSDTSSVPCNHAVARNSSG